jgi:hypothetical protein
LVFVAIKEIDIAAASSSSGAEESLKVRRDWPTDENIIVIIDLASTYSIILYARIYVAFHRSPTFAWFGWSYRLSSPGYVT